MDSRPVESFLETVYVDRLEPLFNCVCSSVASVSKVYEPTLSPIRRYPNPCPRVKTPLASVVVVPRMSDASCRSYFGIRDPLKRLSRSIDARDKIVYVFAVVIVRLPSVDATAV